MSTPHSPEDRVILEMLESGEPYGGRSPVNENDPDTTERVLGRLYTEVMGLVPQELDPVAPPAAVKERLMDRIRPRLTAVEADPRFGARKALAESTTPPAVVPPAAPTAPVGRTGVGRSFWAAAAAVTLLLLTAVGLLTHEVFELRDEVRARSERVEGLTAARVDVVEALRSVSAEVPGRIDVCPMRPVGASQPAASGNLVLVMASQRWYLRARNLAPAGRGQYMLWFLDGDGRPLRRTPLELDHDRAVEIALEGIPADMQAAAVTLEPTAGVTVPSGNRILYGHRQEMERL